MDKERFTTYLQKYNYDCGAGATGIVLANFGSPRINHDLIMSALRVRRNGTDPKNIENFFKKRRKFEVYSKEGATIADLKNELEYGNLCMVLYQGSGTRGEVSRLEGGHYSVVAGISSKYIYLLDPGVAEDFGDGVGWNKLTVPEFRKRWKDKWKENRREVLCERWMLSVGLK